MYGLIDNPTHSPLIVEQFLEPYASDQQIKAIRSTQLGRWLFQTLRQAGIRSSTFASETILTLDTISKHLTGQHPTDSACKLAEPVTDATSEQWGHLEFVRQPYIAEPAIDPIDLEHVLLDDEDVSFSPEPSLYPRKTAEGYLQQFRQLYQLILQIHFVRQNLVRAAAVANVFGERWAYGDPVGQAALDALLTSVFEVTQTYQKVLDDFWTNYYVQHYTPYARKNKKNDANFPCHIWLTRIDREYLPSIMENINDITQSIQDIREQARNLPRDLKCLEKTKKALFLDLLAFMKFQGKEGSEPFNIIQEALSELDKASTELPEHSSDEAGDLLKTQHAIDDGIATFKHDPAAITELTAAYLKKKRDESEHNHLLIERQTKERTERMELLLNKHKKKVELTLETTQVWSADLRSQIADVKRVIERHEVVHTIKEDILPHPIDVNVKSSRSQRSSPSFFNRADDCPSVVPLSGAQSQELK